MSRLIFNLIFIVILKNRENEWYKYYSVKWLAWIYDIYKIDFVETWWKSFNLNFKKIK